MATKSALNGEPATANCGYCSIAFFFHSSTVKAGVGAGVIVASGVNPRTGTVTGDACSGVGMASALFVLLSAGCVNL